MIPPAPSPAPPNSLVVRGPSGSAGTVSCGGVVARSLPRGRWLGIVHARLQTPVTSDPIVPGQVLVMIEVRAASPASRAVTTGDSSFSGRGVYAVRGYLSPGRGLVAYPNVWIGEGDLLSLEASVWSLDNLTYQAVADVTYTMSDAPITGTDSLDSCDNPDSWAPITLQSTDPAANTEASLTIGAGMQVRPDDVWVTLVTDGTAASREVYLRVTRASIVIARHNPVTTQPASTTRGHIWKRGGGIGNTNIGGEHCMPLSDVILRDEDAVGTATGAIQATDNYGVLTLAGRYRVMPEVLDPS